jgi:hypothetical protein
VPKSANDKRDFGPAGIRLGNQKYMFVSRDDNTGCTQLSKRGGGGAALMLTNTAIVIAFYEKEKPFTSGGNGVQTAGACAEQVIGMANYLKGEGY